MITVVTTRGTQLFVNVERYIRDFFRDGCILPILSVYNYVLNDTNE